MSKFLIYGLSDPRIGGYFYIGKSSSGLQRPRQHEKRARQGERGRKADLIRALQAARLQYQITVLEESTRELLNERETWWIAWYRPFGRLTNISDGGLHENDVRAAVRVRWDALSPEQRSEQARRINEKLTTEQREQRSARMRDRMLALSPEQRCELARRAARSMTPEQRGKQGRSHSATIFATTTAEERRAQAKYASSCNPEKKISAVKEYWSSMTSKERSEVVSARWAKITPEARSAQALKGWKTRRQKLSEKERIG